jgi:uncharacterized protein (DUF433 family)
MPQPTNANTCSWGLKALAERPECLAGVGLVAAEWSNFEATLAELYVRANADVVHWPAEGDLEEATSVTIDESHMSVIDSVESTRARLSMITVKLEARAGQQVAVEFKTLAVNIERRARERNTIVHGRWATSQFHPNDLVLRKPRGERMVRYTAADFRQSAERISDLGRQVRDFTKRCEDVLRRPADPHLVKHYSNLRSSVVARDGVFCLQDTEVPVDAIVSLTQTRGIDGALEAYPALTREQIETALDYARTYPDAASREIVSRGRGVPG